MYRNVIVAVEIQSARQRAAQFAGSSHPDPNISCNTAAEKDLVLHLCTGLPGCMSALAWPWSSAYPCEGWALPQLGVIFFFPYKEENMSNTRIASLSNKDCNPCKTLCRHPHDTLNLHFLQLFIWTSADLVENAEETGVYAWSLPAVVSWDTSVTLNGVAL